MTYNMTAIGDNSTGITGFMAAVNNELMFGFLGIFLMIGIAVIIFMGVYASTREFKPAFIASAWVNFILSLLFAAIEITPPLAIFASVVILGLALALPRD